MPDLVEILSGAGLTGTGALLGAAALKFVEAQLARRRTPEQKLGDAASAASDLIRLALDASGTSVQQVLKAQQDLEKRLHQLEESHAACEARCEDLTGELRQANQKIDSLMRQLRDPRSTGPGGALEGAVFELKGGEVLVHAAPSKAKE